MALARRLVALPTSIGRLRARWTATSILSLPVRSSPYTDPGQMGLQLLVRARKSGAIKRTWLYHFKWRGDECRLSIGHPPEMALDLARGEVRKLRELADQGVDPRRARPRRRERPIPVPLSAVPSRPDDRHSVSYLFTEFAERFLRPGRKHPQYAEAVLRKNVLTEWSGRDARTITPREVIELLDRVADRAPVMANRTASLLGQMYRFGIHRQIVADSPVKLLFRPGGREKPRTRFLNDRELTAYLKDPRACTRFGRLACVINILLLTGQRRGELALARWSDISFEERTWTIPDEHSKSGRGHIVPLSERALQEFRALKTLAGSSPWVLPAKKDSRDPLDPKQLTRGIAKCLKRFKSQGIAPFTLHDLRRTCRTGLSFLKVPAHVAERVLNHVQPGIAGVYDRYDYVEEKREALEKWSSHLKALIAADSRAMDSKR